MARILVFGAGGYIGIPLCEELQRRGHWVQAVDRFYFGKFPEMDSPPLQADIRTYTCGDGLFDVVIDLAGLSNDASADIDPDITRSINLDGAKHLAELAKRIGVQKYIYSSSCSVYGAGDHFNLRESDLCHPLTLYAECKLQIEDHLRFLENASFKPIILRNATVFGAAKRMRFDLAVNIMTLRAWREGVIYQMGGGEQWRPFVHVADVVATFCAMVESAEVSGTYNVGNTSLNYSIKQLVTMVKGQLPEARIHNIPDEADRRSYHVSFSRLAEVMQRPSTSVVSGIRTLMSALVQGQISGDDPTCYTLDWYRKLIEWDKRLGTLRIDGKIL
jgi:nucleoside-diphosphate-sugar epimerase